MSNNKRGLGRGFDALIPTDLDQEFDSSVAAKAGLAAGGEQVLQLDVNLVDPNPHQPRQTFNEEALQGLAESIKQHGVVQPLIATPAGDRYQLVAGERRLRASKLAGLATVPVIVRTASEQAKMELALIENLQRADLNPIETATAYRKLIEQFNITQEELGRRLGKARPTIVNTIRLLKLPIEAKRAVAAGQITENQARQILAVPPDKQLELLNDIITNKWTSGQVEAHVRGLKSGGGDRELAVKAAAQTNELTDTLGQYLGTKVMLQPRAKGAGRLIIDYYSAEELQRIYEQIHPQS